MISVILFDFQSTHYKISVHLPCIITPLPKTSSFKNFHFISSSDRQRPILYQGSAYCCEEDRNSDIMFLLQTSQTIHYCNQSVFKNFPDLNIFVWSITIFISFKGSALVQFFSDRVQASLRNKSSEWLD